MFRLFDYDPTAGTPTISEFVNLVHPVDCSHFMQAYQRLNENGEPTNIDFRTNPARGPIRYFNYRAQALRDLQGRLVHLAGTMQDVSERKQLEEQLRQSQKLEAIGQLAGGVAHDFNNLLTVINGYSEILLKSVPNDNPLRGLVTQVATAGKRAESLTGQLLAFSRKQLLAPRIVNLNEILDGFETMLRSLIGENILLQTSFDPQLHHVSVDPNQIEQVIINLAINARDAMPQGGSLNIATGNIFLDEAECLKYTGCTPGSYVRLAVTDTGCGMSSDLQGHIFEPFFTTKEVGKGTGLGLATVYGIVQQSGGVIHLASTPGVGTTFSIFLPAQKTALLSSSSPKINLPTQHGTETILLVEDEEGVRKLGRLILTMLGYKLLEATDGLQAIQIVQNREGPIDLLITDHGEHDLLSVRKIEWAATDG